MSRVRAHNVICDKDKMCNGTVQLQPKAITILKNFVLENRNVGVKHSLWLL